MVYHSQRNWPKPSFSDHSATTNILWLVCPSMVDILVDKAGYVFNLDTLTRAIWARKAHSPVLVTISWVFVTLGEADERCTCGRPNNFSLLPCTSSITLAPVPVTAAATLPTRRGPPARQATTMLSSRGGSCHKAVDVLW